MDNEREQIGESAEGSPPDHHDTLRHQEQQFWHETSERSWLEQNKSLVTLSSSGIGITLLLIGRDQQPAGALDFILMVASWVAFVLSIYLVHESYDRGQKAAKAQVRALDYEFQGLDSSEARGAATDYGQESLKYTRHGFISFLIGVVLTIAFVGVEVIRGVR